MLRNYPKGDVACCYNYSGMPGILFPVSGLQKIEGLPALAISIKGSYQNKSIDEQQCYFRINA